MLKGWKVGLAVIVASAMVVGCAGSNSLKVAPRPLLAHSEFGKLRALANGSFHNVNDAPRHRGAANFESRRAAAHARGLWLTDELNPPKLIAGATNARSTMAITPCTGAAKFSFLKTVRFVPLTRTRPPLSARQSLIGTMVRCIHKHQLAAPLGQQAES